MGKGQHLQKHNILTIVQYTRKWYNKNVIGQITPKNSFCSITALKAFRSQTIVSQLSKCLKFMTFREGCFVIYN